ncbi:MAG: hypothetical protein V4667_06300 [Bacteroidota bacterium]
MKTISKIIAALLLLNVTAFGQNSKSTIGIAIFESKGLLLDGEQITYLAKIETEKLDKYDVLDKYEVKEVCEKNSINFNTCLGKSCLVELGTKLKADKMMSGGAERFGEKIIVTIRIIDVKSGIVDKTNVSEYLNLQPNIQEMIGISIKQILGVSYDEITLKRLTKPHELENSTNNPGKNKLNTSGVRMGLTTQTGEGYKVMTRSKANGGYNAFPVMTQFGYQFETQYLNEGNFQALVEYIPLVTGIDQGYFFPSLSILNGFRNSVSGWEFAFGPTFGLVQKANVYTIGNNVYKENEWTQRGNTGINPHEVTEQLDSRGVVKLNTGFVFAMGKTFRSGKLNIPVNAFVVPGKETWRFGLSFGFNNKNAQN